MKKALLPLAVAALMPAGAMAGGPIDGSLYGKAFLTIDSYDYDEPGSAGDFDEWQVNSAASRIGIQGKSQLSDGLYAVYKAEYEIDVDNGDDVFKQRNIYVGLSGGFGTIIAGKHDTPAKLAQNKVDLFNDLIGDIKNTFEGENREGNIVMYTSPTAAGFALTAAFMAAEGDDVDNDGEEDDGFDGTSLALTYTVDNLYLALAADSSVDEQDLVRFVAQYSVGDLQLGAMYQQNEDADDSDAKDESGYFISASYKIGNGKIKAQYGEIEDDADDDEEETFSIGYDHKLGSNTKALVYYTVNTDTPDGGSDEVEESVFGFGMEHKF